MSTGRVKRKWRSKRSLPKSQSKNAGSAKSLGKLISVTCRLRSGNGLLMSCKISKRLYEPLVDFLQPKKRSQQTRSFSQDMSSTLLTIMDRNGPPVILIESQQRTVRPMTFSPESSGEQGLQSRVCV